MSSYLRLRRFSLSSMTGFLPCLVRMGPPCGNVTHQVKLFIIEAHIGLNHFLWTLTSAPSSDPAVMVSFELVTELGAAGTTAVLFTMGGLTSCTTGTPNACRTCVAQSTNFIYIQKLSFYANCRKCLLPWRKCFRRNHWMTHFLGDMQLGTAFGGACSLIRDPVYLHRHGELRFMFGPGLWCQFVDGPGTQLVQLHERICGLCPICPKRENYFLKQYQFCMTCLKTIRSIS